MLILTLFATVTCAVVALLFSGRKAPAQRQRPHSIGGKSAPNILRHNRRGA
jgi:hypothetical protein